MNSISTPLIKIGLDPDLQLKSTMKYLKRIDRYFRLSIAQPDDIENLHKIRVNLRNFYVNFNYLSPYYPKYKRKIVTSGLKVLKDCTDQIRDLDVFQEHIEKIFEINKDQNVPKNGIDALYYDLNVMRKKRFLDLQKIFFDFISYDFFKYWQTVLNEHRKESEKLNLKFQNLVLNTLKELWYNFESQIMSNIDDGEALQQLRSAGKKFRYSFDSLKDFFPDEVQKEISGIMIDIQDSLGTINDCKMILQMLDKKKAENIPNNNPMVTTTISHRYFLILIKEKKKLFQSDREQWVALRTIDHISNIIYNL